MVSLQSTFNCSTAAVAALVPDSRVDGVSWCRLCALIPGRGAALEERGAVYVQCQLLTPNVAQLFEPSSIIDLDLSLVLVMVLVSSVNSYGAMISSQVEGVCVYV